MNKKLIVVIVVGILAMLSVATVSAQVNLYDPTIGDSMDGVTAAPEGYRFILSPACDLLDGPGGNVVIPGSQNNGGRYPVNAFTTTVTEDDEVAQIRSLSYVRLTIGSESAWADASCGEFIPAG